MAFPTKYTTAVSKLQRLYDACDAVLSSEGMRTPWGITWLQHLLDGMDAADVGIDDDGRGGGDDVEIRPSSWEDDGEPSTLKSCRWPLLPAHAFTRITYVHIHQCQDFSIGVFCFPAGATLPLHDHPEMVVLSKLLCGSVRIRSYDWVAAPPCYGDRRKRGLARVVAADEVRRSPCKTSVLFPRNGGNMHALTAVTPCAILDVLTPPYAEELGRPSTYFNDVPVPSLPGFAFLEEMELPEDFSVAGAPYLGPRLMVDMDDDDDYNDGFSSLSLPTVASGKKGRQQGDWEFRRRFRRLPSSPAACPAPEREESRGITARMYIG